jgi:hypothetical protein
VNKADNPCCSWSEPVDVVFQRLIALCGLDTRFRHAQVYCLLQLAVSTRLPYSLGG